MLASLGICNEYPDSEQCKVAWDIVEELEAADSHKGGVAPADELNYWPLVNGLDILATKLDRKMDDLKNLSEQMVSVGPEIERLYYMADEMKKALAEARAVLPRE